MAGSGLVLVPLVKAHQSHSSVRQLVAEPRLSQGCELYGALARVARAEVAPEPSRMAGELVEALEHLGIHQVPQPSAADVVELRLPPEPSDVSDVAIMPKRHGQRLDQRTEGDEPPRPRMDVMMRVDVGRVAAG